METVDVYSAITIWRRGDIFISHSNNTSHQIRGSITCSTSNATYLIAYRVCGIIQYVGKTRTAVGLKLHTHVGHHFNLPNHFITDMILQGIESVGTRQDRVLANRETMSMRRLRTIQPDGLNIQEGNDQFYSSYFNIFLICCLVLFLVWSLFVVLILFSPSIMCLLSFYF